MKQKILALFLALTLSLSAVGCHFQTPTAVGKLGEVDISAGIYLLTQLTAYQNAESLATEEQSKMSTSKFLKETIELPDPDAEEPAEGEEPATISHVVSEYIANETMTALRFYAAVETKFAELGASLTAEQIASANAQAIEAFEQNKDLYVANGIGLSTMKTYQQYLTKSALLINLIYGEDGTEPIDESVLKTHLKDEMLYAAYVSVPLYNPNTFAFADETQIETIVSVLEDAVSTYDKESTKTTADETVNNLEIFKTALAEHLGKAYKELGMTYDPKTIDSELSTLVLGKGDLSNNFDAATTEIILDLNNNEAVAFKSDFLTAMVMLRLDPESANFETLRSSVLFDLKSDELTDGITAQGEALANNLDESAMKTYSAKNIK